ncbi:MAG: hypothetical protein ACWGQW_19725, partial [bacterium]
SRNAMMTGVYQTTMNTQDQRRRGVILPEGKPIPQLLREADYYTASVANTLKRQTSISSQIHYLTVTIGAVVRKVSPFSH